MEVVEAAGEPGDAGREHFIREVGDLVYHLMVLMRQRNCSLADLEAELTRRFGVSGLDEKASRKEIALSAVSYRLSARERSFTYVLLSADSRQPRADTLHD